MSVGKANYTRQYPVSKDVAFEETLNVLRFLGFEIQSADKSSGLIKAKKGASIRSWGQAIDIAVTQLNEGSQVYVGSKEKYQLVGWGKDQENVYKILTELDTRILAKIH
jgi:hypothetical protein